MLSTKIFQVYFSDRIVMFNHAIAYKNLSYSHTAQVTIQCRFRNYFLCCLIKWNFTYHKYIEVLISKHVDMTSDITILSHRNYRKLMLNNR
jgi:hypothetical protein